MEPSCKYATLVDLLRAQSARWPDKRAYTFLLDGELQEVHLTYQEINRRAQAIGALLQRHGVEGGRVLLLYPPGLDYIAAFFGCLYAGAVAVPAYPPNPARLERTLPRLQAIVADARPAVALTTAPILAVAGMLAAQAPEFHSVQWYATDTIADDMAEDWRAPAIDGATLAFLQYTSGSTATPKGVMLTHANLLHNSEVIQRGFKTTPESRGVFWLPFYHDMGLIGGLIQPIYCGGTSMLLSPVDFLQRPFRWLQAISRFRATISGGPNFAYDLCVRKISPEQRAQLDLSSWSLAFNGAEPIRAETLERFTEAFGPCGFRREAFYPCYGLAEATLLVTGVAVGAAPLVGAFDAHSLELGRAVAVEAEPRAQTLVGSGQPLQTIAIVHPETATACALGQVGEIWVGSPSIAQGYWNRPAESAQSFGARLADDGEAGPFLRTGDLGFVHAGELFVTGRIKDLIIIRGRNHYPQDIELTVERSHPVLRPGCGAAVSVEVGGEERLVIVQEIERQQRNVDVEAAAAAIRQAVAQQHELHVYAVALLRPGSIPKTSSGKIQRHACRAGFLDGTLETVGTSQLDEQATPSVVAELTRTMLLDAAASERQPLLAAYIQAQIARVLRVDPAQIDLERPVSAFGLDSLMAVELQHTIETDLGVVISMVSFLQDHSMRQLVVDLLAQLDAVDTPARPAPAAHGDGPLPLSPGQGALWFLHQLAPESAAYNIASAVRIVGVLDVPALRRSLQRLLDRHPSLRTTFGIQQGEPVQQVHERVRIAIEEQDAGHMSESELTAWLQAAAQRPFDLQRGPLLRIDLLARSADEHILLVTMHHSVGDLWSLAVLTRELGVIYPAECAGVAAPLPPPSLRYSDYVRWQTDVLAGSEGERLWRYWQQQLADAATTLNLPIDRPRPPIQTYNGAIQFFTLEAGLAGRLKALAEARGATLYTVLLAAFEVLLYRYSGQHDFLIGTPTVGRSRAEFTNIVGYFVNPIVLRADLAGQPRFTDLVERVRQTSFAAFAHQDYPFVTLVERMQLGRDLSRSPLFQVMFALQKAPSLDDVDLTAFALSEGGNQINVGGLLWEPIPLVQRVAQFDLSLAIGETRDGLAAALEYNTDLFDNATAQRIARHFQTMLEAIATDPGQHVDDLPLLNPAERRQVLIEWNATAADIRVEAGVHTLFEAQARRTPNAIAVIYGDERLTYGELNERADALAQRLRGLGVAPETLVGICADRSVEMMVGIMAILKAGGAYLPLDSTYPSERLAFILNQTRAPVLLTQAALRDSLPPHGAHVICLDGDGDGVARAALPRATVHAENVACVIYTSGSTGQPKGVELTHGGIVNLIESFVRSYEPGAADRILPLTSLASASFVGEIFPLLCAGGALVLPNSMEVLDFEALCSLITRRHVTMLSTVPSLIARLNSRADALPELRLILSGGEALTHGDIDKLVQTTTISNGYGLTETTVCSTFYHVPPRRTDRGSYIPIGRPLVNTQVYILDEHMHPVPIGAHGELYVGGLGLARGYLDDPALTAERFVPDPFATTDDRQLTTDDGFAASGGRWSAVGGRLYKTGDRARWLPDGLIEFVGRIDHQVKIRGFRIELGEIETVLAHHAAVREAVVVAREDTPGSRRLIAYIVPTAEDRGWKIEDSHAATSEIPSSILYPLSSILGELRTFLAERLPNYMVPAAFVLLDALPLTPNGKVDLRVLPPPSGERPETATAYLAPRSELEHAIATVWQAALKVEKVGIYDNFFDLGGHSLLLVQVHSQLRETYSQLTLIDMFRHPTVGALAAHLSAVLPAEETFVELQDRAQKQKAFRDRRKEIVKNRAGS